MQERRQVSTANKIIWFLMTTFLGITTLGFGAWAQNVNGKIDKIVGLETSVVYIQRDIAEIKEIIKDSVNRGYINPKMR